MNRSSELWESGEAEHEGGPPIEAEMHAFEERIGAALREEAADAAMKLQALGAELDSSSKSEAIDTDAFADSMRIKWQREASESHAGKTAAAVTGKIPGRTACLPNSAARPAVTPVHSFAGSWWAAAAAAAILAGAFVGVQSLKRDELRPSGANLESVAVTPTALYLGSKSSSSANADAELSLGNKSTSPEILPETVDFSHDVSEGTYRIEIYDVTRKPRIDEASGPMLKTTIYEARWTCPETTRAKLPDVFRLEVYRSADPPGAPEVYRRVFLGQ